MQKARIRLTAMETQKLDEDIAGPIPLPTKKLKVPVRKSTSGDGKATWERWEMRIHKRLIEIDADERTMRQIMRVKVPERVNIEIELLS